MRELIKNSLVCALLSIGNLIYYVLLGVEGSRGGLGPFSLPLLVLVFILGYASGKVPHLLMTVLEYLSLLLIPTYWGLSRSLPLTFIKDAVVVNSLIFIASLGISTRFFREVPSLPEIRVGVNRSPRTLITSASGLLASYLIIGYLITPLFPELTYYSLLTLGLRRNTLVLATLTIVTAFLILIMASSLIVEKPSVLIPLGLITSLPLVTLPALATLPSFTSTEVSRVAQVTLGSIHYKLRNRWVRARGHLRLELRVGRNNHIIILGSSGSGKTTLGKKVASQLRGRGVPAVIIDPHGEYSDIKGAKVLSPEETFLNILDMGEGDIRSRASSVSDLISSAFNMGFIQRSVLQKILEDLYSELGSRATIHDLRDYINSLTKEKEGKYSRDTLKSILPYIDTLAREIKPSGWVKVEDLLKGVSVIDVSRLRNEGVVRVYVEVLLEGIFRAVRSSRRAVLVIVEEVHRFLGGRAPVVERLFKEGRKFGLNVLAITQEPSSIPHSLLANTSTVVSFSLSDPYQAAYVSRIFSAGDSRKQKLIRDKLMSLKPLEALVWVKDGGVFFIKV